jgi:RNA polymerase sigma-70 factor (ECF subfamily)
MASRPRGEGGRHEATVAGAAADGVVSDDGMLMAGVAAEEMDAFEALYRRYHPRLVRFLDGMTRRPALVEEVLDDTMLVVWRRAHTWLPTAKVSTWIFGIAYRQALKALRQVDDAVEFHDTDEQADASDDNPSSASPDGVLQQQQVRIQLDRALAMLSPEQRAVIQMTYYLGYSCRDIAQVMDCPVDTVKTRMFYARRRLRTLLGDSREEAL